MPSEANLTVLRSAALALPRPASRRRFDRLLDSTFDGYRSALADLDGDLRALLADRREAIDAQVAELTAAWRAAAGGDRAMGLTHLAAALAAIEPWLAPMSARLASVADHERWYRLSSWDGVTSHEHMFHAPFGTEVGQYRFSVPGAPSLYLGNSTYLCWLECASPDLDRCHAARFELDLHDFRLLDLPTNSAAHLAPFELADDLGRLAGIEVDPRTVTNSPYEDDVVAEVAEYLTVWPFLAALTFEKRGGNPSVLPEYVIPQLLASWVERSDVYVGIRYFTSKDDPSASSQDWSINVALPARDRKPAGYSDVLAAHTRWTDPQSFATVHGLTDDAVRTEEAVDAVERHSGRLALPDGAPYHVSPFGRMEYWLNRPELALSSL